MQRSSSLSSFRVLSRLSESSENKVYRLPALSPRHFERTNNRKLLSDRFERCANAYAGSYPAQRVVLPTLVPVDSAGTVLRPDKHPAFSKPMLRDVSSHRKSTRKCTKRAHYVLRLRICFAMRSHLNFYECDLMVTDYPAKNHNKS